MIPSGVDLTPFTADDRASGILLHVTSLPSPFGIGDFGPVAQSWIDRLGQAGQGWWQVLPLGPTGYGNSPYQPVSSFAGNALFISPDWLIEDGLVGPSDCEHRPFDSALVDYDAIIPFKHALVQKARNRFMAGARADLRSAYERFRYEQNDWLEDYALFTALKGKFDNAYYLEWPAELVEREPAALGRVRRELADQIDEACFAQFLLSRQGERLKTHAHTRGLKLVGDLPFFVSPDSSDVWAHPELFVLDERHRPRFVAGVPPDYFSPLGQLWGNPVYNWEALEQSGYRWWTARLRSLLKHVDAIRLDHFRGFVAAWHIPAGGLSAQSGRWVPGPGAAFFRAVERDLGGLPFIAEDLGTITPEVNAVRDHFHLPGMRILQFAFDGHADNPYLPENYDGHTVVYTGTHDNPTTRAWSENLTYDQREKIRNYVKLRGAKSDEAARALIELAWSSVAALAMAPLQDLLNLGSEARMNIPGRPDGNWRWRTSDDMLSDRSFEWLCDLTKNANRSRDLEKLKPGGLATTSTN
jgi:4-alpha-glucanotransferase